MQPAVQHSTVPTPGRGRSRRPLRRTRSRAPAAALASLQDELKTHGMWDTTILFFLSDNGGPVYTFGTSGASNYPLLGGKMSNWEGGIRTPAFVAGGAVRQSMRGTKLHGLITAWDWFATLAEIAGAPATDPRAAKAGLPPPDSLSVWGYINGNRTESPRSQLVLGSAGGVRGGETQATGVIAEDTSGRLWKLLVGNISQYGWQGPSFPNASTAGWDGNTAVKNCGEAGCLFELRSDPTEHVDLAGTAVEQLKQLQLRVQ